MDMLPDDIISHVASFLTVRDAARMNTLARKYRFVSSSMCKLDFSWSSVRETEEFKECQFKCYDICNRHKYSFVRSINQFIANYSGASIHRFAISFCLGREFIYDVERWISFAVKLGAEHLVLKFSCQEYIYSSEVINPVESKLSNFLVFPSYRLLQGTESKLKHLNLQSCVFGLDSSHRFSSIITLRLCDVPLSSDDFERVLTCCLNLEYLKLTYCYLPDKFIVCGSELRLKTLIVVFCFCIKEVQISATDLVAFEYAGDALEFSFFNLPKLERVHYRASCNRGLGYIFSRFGKDIPQLKCLSVSTEYDWVTSMPSSMTALRSLKRLDLFLNIHTPIIAKNVITILKVCPVLQKFNIVTTCWEDQDAIPNVELGTCVHDHLKKVVFCGFAATTYAVAVVMYLVGNAVTLEKLVLDVQSQIYEGDSVWTRGHPNKFPKDERDKLIKILYERAASKDVVITMIGKRV